MKYRKFKKQYVIFALLLIIALVFCMPLLLTDGIIKGDDLYFHLERITALAASSTYPNQIQSWWLQGWGYAIGAYYPDLFIQPFSLLVKWGVSLSTSYKLLVFTLNTTTVLVTYYCFKKIIKNDNIAFLGVVVYIFAPYRLSDFYSRAAIGECFAFLFIPLIIQGLYQLYTVDTEAKEYKYIWILPSLGFAGLLSSHLLSSLMVGLFTIIVVLINIKKSIRKKTILNLLAIAVVAILLSLWFLIPFVDFSSTNTVFVDKMSYNLKENAASLIELLNPIPFITTHTTLPIQIGLSLLIGIVLLLVVIVTKKELNMLIVTVLLISALSLFMSSTLFPYDLLIKNTFINNIFGKVQFPWRYQTISVASLSMCTMIAVNYFKKDIRTPIVLVLSLLSVIYLPMYHLYLSSNGTESSQIDWLDSGYVSFGEYLPFCDGANVDYYNLMKDTNIYGDQDIVAENMIREDTSLSFNVFNKSDINESAYLPLNYYAQYKVKSDPYDTNIKLSMNEEGRVSVLIPGSYDGLITVFYQKPWYYLLGCWVSLGLLILIACSSLFRLLSNRDDVNNSSFF